MKHPRIFRTLAFAIVLSGSIISFTAVAHADCPAGFQNNMDTNVSTGITIYFCSPLGDQNFAAYDPHITPNAPVAAEEFTPAVAPAVNTTPTTTIPVVAVTAVVDVVPVVTDPNDPFPLLALGDVIPDTYLFGKQVDACPFGSVESFDVKVQAHLITGYCVKSYTAGSDPTPIDTPAPTQNPIYTSIQTILDPAVSNVPIVRVGGLAGSHAARGD